MATTYTQTLTDGDDTFVDVPGRNTYIIGLAGNDIIYGENGDDWLNGDVPNNYFTDFGNDTLYGGDGNDLILGMNGNDTLYGGNGSDTLFSGTGEGDDKIYGGSGNDDIHGGDIVYGEDGDDKFDVGGSAIAYGGKGNDLISSYSFGSGVLAGGSGDDVYNMSVSDVTIPDFAKFTADFGKIIEKPGEGIDTLSVKYVRGVLIEAKLPANVENLSLYDRVDTGVGNSLDNIISAYTTFNVSLFGLAGNDTLKGSFYDDTLDGGTGNDILQSASMMTRTSSLRDIDTVSGGKGDDIYYADTSDKIIENKHEGVDKLFAVPISSLSTDFYVPDNVENMTILDPDYKVIGTVYFDGYGNDQRNTIEGNSYDNALFGYGGNDFLIGGDGNDELDGGKGRDRYDGGAGNDQFIYDPADFRGNGGKGENAGTEGNVGLSSTESNSTGSRGKGAESQYSGGTGTDSLVLPIAFPHLDLTKLADSKIRGIDVIEAEPSKGGAASLTLTASDVIAISDNGTLRIEDGFGAGILSVYSKNQGWTLSGTEVIDDVTYEVYKVGQATLVVDADLGGVMS